jgi:hypothetical protein
MLSELRTSCFSSTFSSACSNHHACIYTYDALLLGLMLKRAQILLAAPSCRAVLSRRSRMEVEVHATEERRRVVAVVLPAKPCGGAGLDRAHAGMDPENCACSPFILALLTTELHFGLLRPATGCDKRPGLFSR